MIAELAGYLVSIRLDRWDNERLAWSPAYGQQENSDYHLMRDESNRAVSAKHANHHFTCYLNVPSTVIDRSSR